MGIEHTFIARSIKGGVAYALPAAATLPTTVALPLDPLVVAGHLGMLAQDGLTISETRESKTEPDFDGDDYVTYQIKYGVEVKFKLIDVDKEQVEDLLNGVANIVRTAANGTHGNLTEINHTGEQLPLGDFLFTTKSGDKVRFDTLQDARVSNVAEFKLESQNVTGVEVTLKGTKDGEGRLFRTFKDDGKIVPGPVTVDIAATGDFRIAVGGHYSIQLDETATTAAVKSAIEGIYGFSGTATVTGSAGAYHVVLSAGGVITVTGDATIS